MTGPSSVDAFNPSYWIDLSDERQPTRYGALFNRMSARHVEWVWPDEFGGMNLAGMRSDE